MHQVLQNANFRGAKVDVNLKLKTSLSATAGSIKLPAGPHIKASAGCNGHTSLLYHAYCLMMDMLVNSFVGQIATKTTWSLAVSEQWTNTLMD